MAAPLRCLPRAALRTARPLRAPILSRNLSLSRPFLAASPLHPPPAAPDAEDAALRRGKSAQPYLGTAKRLPEFNLTGKVVLITGAGRGLGLVQAEALLEAGAIGLSHTH